MIPAVRTECKNILPSLSELTDIPVARQVIVSRSDIQMVSRKAGVQRIDKQIMELNIDLTPLHPETELRKAGVIFD